jgi:hypothetical protein
MNVYQGNRPCDFNIVFFFVDASGMSGPLAAAILLEWKCLLFYPTRRHTNFKPYYFIRLEY